MSAAKNRARRVGGAGDVVWDALPIALMELDAARRIVRVNAAAQALVPTVDIVGLDIGALFGLAGGSGLGGVFADSGASAAGRTRVHLSDDRLFDLQLAPQADGGAIVSLFDVGAYIREAELGAKDPLTGLLNRAGLNARLQEALADADRGLANCALLYIDLDRFKAVNDTLGHPVGDALLVKVADRLRSAARKGDIIARMGGDEFAIIQRGGDQPIAAESLAARLVDLVGRAYVVSGHSINIGASVGVALAPLDVTADALITRADLALCRAKASGRGQFSFFEPEMDAQMQRRRAMELDLRRALAMREFELAFQPQFDLTAGGLTGFEALLRWRSGERGLVSPADFIPLAEEIGLIIPIGDWVLREACKRAASWRHPVSVAVNLSAHQFQSIKLVETVASALAHSGLDPARLELEITEGALLDDTTAVLGALQAIRALGVKISMDDFGTGYSSLSYLQKFPFHKIKIDQSFVRRMEKDAESKAIVRAIAALGASLGMTTTAEGVETVEQLDLVRMEGCTHVQGYLTGRPLSAAAAAELAVTAMPIPLEDVRK